MKTSRWLAALLVVSLVINLLMGGFVLGQHSHRVLFGDPTRAFPRWVRSLPEPRQEALRPLVREHIKQFAPSFRDMRQQHLALQEAITADPFEADHLRTTLATMRQAHAASQQTAHSAFVTFVSKLTPAEREALVADMRKPRRGGPWRRPGHPQ